MAGSFPDNNRPKIARTVVPALLFLAAILLLPFLGRGKGEPGLTFAEWKSVLGYQARTLIGRSGGTWNGVVVGLDGWLYYHEELEHVFPLEESRSLARNLRLIQDFLEARGTRFLFFIAPDKHRIYPEFLPADADRRFPERDQDLSPLQRALREEGVAYLDLYALLDSAKRAQPPEWTLYAPGGTHWTPFGTGLAVGEIFRRLGRTWEGAPAPTSWRLNPNDDLVSTLHLSAQYRFRRKVPSAEPAARLRSHAEDREGRREWLFVGDSFLRIAACSYLMGLPPAMFSSLSQELMREHDLRYVYGLAPTADLLVKESYERAVFGFVERALWVYAERFRDLTFLADFDGVFQGARQVFSMGDVMGGTARDAEVLRAGPGMSLRFTGDNPAFAFPEFREGWEAAYHKWIRIEAESSDAGEIGIRYRGPDGPRTEFLRIPKGISLRHFCLPRGGRELEILPARSPARLGGVLVIRSLAVAL